VAPSVLTSGCRSYVAPVPGSSPLTEAVTRGSVSTRCPMTSSRTPRALRRACPGRADHRDRHDQRLEPIRRRHQAASRILELTPAGGACASLSARRPRGMTQLWACSPNTSLPTCPSRPVQSSSGDVWLSLGAGSRVRRCTSPMSSATWATKAPP